MASPLYARYIPPPVVRTSAVNINKPSRQSQPTKRKFDTSTQEQDATRENDAPPKKRRASKRPKVEEEANKDSRPVAEDVPSNVRERSSKETKRQKKLQEAETNDEDMQPTVPEAPDHSKKSTSRREKHTKKKTRRKEDGVGDDARVGDADVGNLDGDETRADRSLRDATRSKDASKDKTETTFISSDDQDEAPLTESDAIDGLHSGDAKHNAVMSKFHRSSIIAELLAKKDAAESSRDRKKVEQSQEVVQVQGLVPLPQPAEVPDSITKPTFSALPSWLARPTLVRPTHAKSFSDLGVSSKLASVLEAKGYKEALPIQSTVLPMLLPRDGDSIGDVCISAATGSGKTLAYVLPIVETLRSRILTRLRALVVLPTRELVSQVREVFELCAGGSGVKIGTAVGNRPLRTEQNLIVNIRQKYDPRACEASYTRPDAVGANEHYDDFNENFDFEDQVETLPGYVVEYTSKNDVLICTPGRLVDHIQSTPGFTLDYVQWFVIDEADRLLNQSFQEWVGVVMRTLEAEKPYDQLGIGDRLLLDIGCRREPRDLRKIFLSATMTRDVEKLSAFKLRRPQLVVLDTPASDSGHGEVGSSDANLDGEKGDPEDIYTLPATLHENAVAVGEGHEKPLYLLQLLLTKLLSEITPSKSYDLDRLQSSDVSETSDDETSSATSSVSLRSAKPSTDSASDSDSSGRKSRTSSQDFAKEPLPHGRQGSVLVFTNNNENATRLTRLLSIIHPPFASRIGTLTKSSATSTGRKTLAAFRSGKLSILIASDRASRGLDVPNLAHVVNYDIPTSVTGYVHRVGRTARAGQRGEAWTFTSKTEARWFWNEIAKGPHVKRAQGREVSRAKISVDDVGDEGRERYAQALRTLQQEVQGP
ncbi:MAG: hypothetical protein M1812_002372 [Candelaria pacifica]|nr:MAG: hypothetical protein M1812_002372 [Candelaria pacifica]